MNKNNIRVIVMEPPILYRSVLLGLLTIVVYMAGSATAYASPPAPTLHFCAELHSILGGNFFKGMATLAVVIIGIAAMFGKIQWSTAILCAVGIAVLFGAAAIVTLLHGHSC